MTQKRLGSKFYISLGLGIVLLYMVGSAIMNVISGKPVTTSDLISIATLLMFFMRFITWGMDRKAEMDEMGRRINYQSAKISYFLLIVILFILWIMDRLVFVRKDDLGNMTLFFALCISLVLLPTVEFFLSRRYK
ncbi:hypothetical protein [Aneurinibacillus terranovensis]|uniref:hypothetical protein n=1 Tax=Aneurinibacillus terranovensis TaxID=278991 RepID=UPI00042552DE|nr:hypothetical protein [Aneurinibacillus terranovensis]